MRRIKKPRVVFELERGEHKKAKTLAKKDSRKTVSAYAKARFIEHLASKP